VQSRHAHGRRVRNHIRVTALGRGKKQEPQITESGADAEVEVAVATEEEKEVVQKSEEVEEPTSGVNGEESSTDEVLACPVCQQLLVQKCYCPRCRIGYPKQADGNFLDLTITAASPATSEEEAVSKSTSVASQGQRENKKESILSKLPGVSQLDAIAKAANLPTSADIEELAREVALDGSKVVPSGQLSTTTFQSPLVSFIYERGWRQQFRLSGFPGPDAEYDLAKNFLLSSPLLSSGPGVGGATLLDCSCGSGLFTRRFASDSDLPFERLIALDFSESMLRQTNASAAEEAGGETYPYYSRSLELVRADVARLPFATGSLDGIHAGAAIHCWPAPEVGMAELARVLKPGAALVLSTFRTQSVIRANRSFRLWEESELRDLSRQVGLVNFKAELREPAFIMISAEKPGIEQR